MWTPRLGGLRSCRSRRKALKDLAGALHVDGVQCTLSIGREIKMEIPATLLWLPKE